MRDPSRGAEECRKLLRPHLLWVGWRPPYHSGGMELVCTRDCAYPRRSISPAKSYVKVQTKRWVDRGTVQAFSREQGLQNSALAVTDRSGLLGSTELILKQLL